MFDGSDDAVKTRSKSRFQTIADDKVDDLDAKQIVDDIFAASAKPRKRQPSVKPKQQDDDFVEDEEDYENEYIDYGDDDEAEFGSVFSSVATALGGAASASWRALRHGERMDGNEEEPSKASVPALGSAGMTLSDYITKWNSRSLAVAAGWYIREAHHDPQGADPFMMSMFLVGFCARLFYTSFVEAFILAVLVDFVETMVWFVVRAVSPVLATELNACESRWVSLVYNVFSIGSGLAVGSLVLHTWPGLQSVWAALEDKGCGEEGTFLLWAPCTDAQTFTVVALLFILIMLAAFRSLYAPATIGLVLLVSLTWITGVTYDAANNLTLQALSAAYFWAWMLSPIRNSNVYNGIIAVSLYLFIYSIAALSGTL